MILLLVLFRGSTEHPYLPEALQISLDMLDHKAKLVEWLLLQPKLAVEPSLALVFT